MAGEEVLSHYINIYIKTPDCISGFSGTTTRTRRNQTPIRYSPTWNPQFPVPRRTSLAVQAVAAAPYAPRSPAPTDAPPSPAPTDRTLSYPPSPASTLKNDTDDQMSFSVTRSGASRLRNNEPSFTTLASTYQTLASIRLDSAPEAPGTGSSVEEYRPKGADL